MCNGATSVVCSPLTWWAVLRCAFSKGLGRRPVLNSCAGDGGGNDANGHACALVQVPSKEPRDCTEHIKVPAAAPAPVVAHTHDVISLNNICSVSRHSCGRKHLWRNYLT